MRIFRINLKKFSLSFNSVKINLVKLLFIIFVIGFVFGCILIGVNKQEVLPNLDESMQKFIHIRKESSFLVNFTNSLTSTVFFILILFVLGLLPFGQPFAFFVPLFHGLGLGLLISYLYFSQGVKGFLFYLFSVVPYEVCFVLILILGAKFSIRFSNENFKKLVVTNYKKESKLFFKLYVMQFLILLVFQTIASFLDSLLNYIFLVFLIK